MKKWILKLGLGFVLSILLAVGAVNLMFYRTANAVLTRPQFEIRNEVLQGNIELGRRIFMVRSGCVECHGTDLSGAKVMENGAMGSIYGANITPYKLKDWTDEEIAIAIRYGQAKDGRSLKFMPSFDYAGMSKGDLAALIAFIRSVPEVQKMNHENTFGPIARVMSTLGKMPVMFPAHILDPSRGFNEKPEETPTVEFGRYLANACIGCHLPTFSGGRIEGGDPSWPPASDIRLGKNPDLWTEEAFKKAILSGVSPTSQQPLRAPMPVALLQQMNETEIQALWLYLSSLH